MQVFCLVGELGWFLLLVAMLLAVLLTVLSAALSAVLSAVLSAALLALLLKSRPDGFSSSKFAWS